jgi:hypothetical protein
MPATLSFPQEGGCLCRAIRFRLDRPPRRIGWCHCQSCRKHSGAPAAAFADCARADVTFTHGALTLYASSPGVRRGFCAVCGSTLSYESDGRPDEIDLHIGAFDRADLFTPNAPATFPAERLPWAPQGDPA